MLKRLYVNNYKCLVNFDATFDALSLFLGGNGSGKTSVFEVLFGIPELFSGNVPINQPFPPNSLTRWQKSELQRFEFEMVTGNEHFTYTLEIEHSRQLVE